MRNYCLENVYFRNNTGHISQHFFDINWYQNNARVYMDEYEVEEWDYLPLFDNTFVMDRFLRRE